MSSVKKTSCLTYGRGMTEPEHAKCLLSTLACAEIKRAINCLSSKFIQS